jgi:hypothetical protein
MFFVVHRYLMRFTRGVGGGSSVRRGVDCGAARARVIRCGGVINIFSAYVVRLLISLMGYGILCECALGEG